MAKHVRIDWERCSEPGRFRIQIVRLTMALRGCTQERDSVVFYVNGSRRELRGTDAARSTLLSFLRRDEQLTGAKLCCGEGGCGACTVMLSKHPDMHFAVNACLVPLPSVHAMCVTTVEALADPAEKSLTPLQQSLASAHASQCGFCTPGFVMSLHAELSHHAIRDTPTHPVDIEDCLQGNLCRCTGYRPIVDGIRSMLCDSLVHSTSCQHNLPKRQSSGSLKQQQRHILNNSACNKSCARRQQQASLPRIPILPAELAELDAHDLNIANVWFRPTSLRRLLELRKMHLRAKLIGGNTEIGIETAKLPSDRSAFISCAAVPELTCVIDDREHGLIIGAAVTWTALLAAIDTAVERRKHTPKDYQTSSLQSVRSQLGLFAGRQIRNVATVGGNIVTASPISDLNPVWIATDAAFTVIDACTNVKRSVRAEDFFVAYRKVDLAPTEVLLAITVPWNIDPFDFAFAFKLSRRKHDDIAIVSAGVRLRVEECRDADSARLSEHQIAYARVGLGGMDAKAIAATKVQQALQGQPLCCETLEAAINAANTSLSLPENVPGGMPLFRLALVSAFLIKSFCKIVQRMSKQFSLNGAHNKAKRFSAVSADLHEKYGGVIDLSERKMPPRGCQIFSSSSVENQKVTASELNHHVGRPVKHASAVLQVTGEAQYLDDMPKVSPRELQAALVLSRRAHAKILKVDIDAAMKISGVHNVVLAKDVPGNNVMGPTHIQDELCFAVDEVTCVGQVIGIAIAETLQQAKDAAAAVAVEYEDLPAVITIEDAIEAEKKDPGSHVVEKHEIQVGSVDGPLLRGQDENRYVSGVIRIGAQEHFYLEPHGALVIPGENDEYMIYSSTQATSKTQEVVAHVLGTAAHKIVCRVKRIGGGFGGKETRSIFISAAAAVAASKAGRPVRLVLSRDEDMLISGTRHAFMARYECSFREDFKLSAVRVDMSLNMGNTNDLSVPVLDRALLHCQNCYDIENVQFIGRVYKSHSPSSTAFRGFGGPQGMLIAETIMEHVAMVSRAGQRTIRDLNLYGKHENGYASTVGMTFDPRPLVLCWDGVLDDSSYEARKAEIDQFNRRNRYCKRGISVVPTMFGISFTYRVYNQAGALVHVYHTDGSVLITHGGVEMGQGLHTKVCQVAATAFEIPMEKVFVSETASDKVANAAPTAASASSDLYGMAVLDACEQIKGRLAKVRAKYPNMSRWEDLVHQAWQERVDLSAHGFYRTPSLDVVDLSQSGAKGRPFYYYTNGAAVSVVEVDTLTGQHVILSTHIVMDVGRPLNPAIDIGQIEGAFVQGLGWCTLEEVVRGSHNSHRWLRPGQMHTLGPGTYKIPGCSDIPEDFNVRILSDVRNEQSTIHSSKGVGEPPLFLASSVFFAIRYAIAAARSDAGLHGWFELDSPATVERIRLACQDNIMERAEAHHSHSRPALTL